MPRRTFSDRRRGLSSISVDLSPMFESRPFRSLITGQIASLIGTQMRYVAMAWQIFLLTGSSAAVGLLGLAEVIPMIVVSILAGPMADIRDRKKIMFWSQAALMVVSATLAVVALADRPALWTLYGLTALGAAFDALDKPARNAVIPNLVGPDKIAPAIALKQISFQVSLIVGPALGGLAVAGFSLSVVYAIDAATFIVALLSLRALPAFEPRGERGPALTLLREGLRFSIGRPLIRSVFLVDLTAMIFGMPRAVFPALARGFGIGAGGLGVLYSAPAVGALIGASLSGWVGRIGRHGAAIFIAAAVWGASIAAAGIFGMSFVPLLAFLALAGAADVFSAVFRGTLVQEATPDELRGRVTAVNTLVVTGGPRVGDIEAGFAASLFGARGSVIAGGVACLIGTGALFFTSPELRNYARKISRRPDHKHYGGEV